MEFDPASWPIAAMHGFIKMVWTPNNDGVRRAVLPKPKRHLEEYHQYAEEGKTKDQREK